MTSSLRINIGDLSCSVWTPNSLKFWDPETKTCARVEAAAFQKILLCVMVASGHGRRFRRVLRLRMPHFRRFHHVLYLRVRHFRRFFHVIWLRVQHCRRFLHVLWLKVWHFRRLSHLVWLRARQLRRNVPPAICLSRMLRHLWKEWDHIHRNFIKKVQSLFLSDVPLHTYSANYYKRLWSLFCPLLFISDRCFLRILPVKKELSCQFLFN
jgi:hypothetical protein